METPRPSRPRKKLLIVLIVVFAVFGFLALITVAGLFFVLTSKDMPVTPADWEAVLHARHLTEFMEDFEPVEGAETLTKTKFFDGSVDLDYEYEHPSDDPPLYLSCSITVDRKASDAMTGYAAVKFGLDIGLKMEGGEISREPADHLLRWGDQSDCSILKNAGVPVGNILVVRKGRRVFALTLSGLYFDDPGTFRLLVLPVLERFSAYEP